MISGRKSPPSTRQDWAFLLVPGSQTLRKQRWEPVPEGRPKGLSPLETVLVPGTKGTSWEPVGTWEPVGPHPARTGPSSERGVS